MPRFALLLLLVPGAITPQSAAAQSAMPSIVRYHFGDDPAWANPSFDDSAWPAAPDGDWPIPRASSGGFLWVRERVAVRSDAAPPLAIRVTNSADIVPTEIFLNGRSIGRLGSFPPYPQYKREAVFDLPGGLTAPGASAVVALREWYPPVAHNPFALPTRNVRAGVEVDGSRTLQLKLRAEHADSVVANGPNFALNILMLFLGGGLLLWWLRFRDRELLLCSLLLIGQTLYMLELHLFALRFLPISWRAHALADMVFNVVTMYIIIDFLWTVYGLRSVFLKALAMAALAGFNGANAFLILATNYSQFTSSALLTLNLSLVGFNLVQGGVSVWMLFVRRQKRGIAAALVLIPITALLGLASISSTLIGPFFISYFEAALIVSEISLFTMLSHRAWQEWRARADLRNEFNAAREVQERLVPPAVDVPGFRFQSVYRPAKDVGGDFLFVRAGHHGRYQDNRDLTGGAFVVVGDVSGKGLRAALTVSAIMGALRTMPDLEPARILVALNRGLVGQLGGGFVTCCAITISADGLALFANAGHLQPYCNGKEVTLDCGLPLGILPDAQFTETRLRLAPTDRLTLITDGILEARNPTSGELFGFDRTLQLSSSGASAIAQAAQAFGQEDDITVLTLTFTGAEVLHA